MKPPERICRPKRKRCGLKDETTMVTGQPARLTLWVFSACSQFRGGRKGDRIATTSPTAAGCMLECNARTKEFMKYVYIRSSRALVRILPLPMRQTVTLKSVRDSREGITWAPFCGHRARLWRGVNNQLVKSLAVTRPWVFRWLSAGL